MFIGHNLRLSRFLWDSVWGAYEKYSAYHRSVDKNLEENHVGTTYYRWKRGVRDWWGLCEAAGGQKADGKIKERDEWTADLPGVRGRAEGQKVILRKWTCMRPASDALPPIKVMVGAVGIPELRSPVATNIHGNKKTERNPAERARTKTMGKWRKRS